MIQLHDLDKARGSLMGLGEPKCQKMLVHCALEFQQMTIAAGRRRPTQIGVEGSMGQDSSVLLKVLTQTTRLASSTCCLALLTPWS